MKFLFKKIMLVNFALLALQTDWLHAQRYDKTIQLEGKKREYIVVRPTGQVPVGGYPVVFMFHGTSGDGTLFWETSGWKELGQQEKFITVFPSSLHYCIVDEGKNVITTKWNNGDLQSAACPGQDFKNDVLFFRNMVDTIKSIFSINANRIYVCGFSNGGIMASKLAAESSDIIAASVCAEGILHQLDSAAINPRIPCWLTIGTLDDRFTTALNRLYLPYNDTILVLLQGILGNFTGALGLQAQYSKKDSGENLTIYEFNRTIRGELTPNRFVFLLAKNMFHVFPNGTNYKYFESAPLYWNFFFKNIIKASTTPIHDSKFNQGSIRLSPNPVSNLLTLYLENRVDEKITIFNAHGASLMSVEIKHSSQTIDVSAFPSGMYSIVSRNGIGKFIKT